MNWGGRREGAGRPKSSTKIMKTIKLEKNLLDRLEEIPGSFTEKVVKGLELLIFKEEIKMLNKVKEIIKAHNGSFGELLKTLKKEYPESLCFWEILVELNMAKSDLQAFGDDKLYFGEVFNLRDDFSRQTVKNKEEFEFFTKLRRSIVKYIDDSYNEDFIETAKDEGLNWDIKPKDAIMCHLSKKLKDTNLNTYKEQVQKMEEEIKEKVIAMIKDKMGEKAPYKKEWI